MKKAIVFFSYYPFPPRAGCQHRVAQVIEGLQRLGYTITLVTHGNWHGVRLRRMGRDYLTLRNIRYQAIDYHPAGLHYGVQDGRIPRRQFNEIVTSVDPDLVWMCYAHHDYLCRDIKRNYYTVLDTIDLIGKHAATWHELETRSHFEQMYEFDEMTQRLESWRFQQREFRICDSYEKAIAICPEEQKILLANGVCSVVCLPPHFGAVQLENTYADRPIFVASGNIFNYHACCVLAERVLAELKSFGVDIIGTMSWYRQLQKYGRYLRIRGQVSDLRPFYKHAAFVASPIVFGTGLKVKYLDAMAHGVPILALQHQVADCPIANGHNGIAVETVPEFREWFVRLAGNRSLRAKLGAQARETMRDFFTQDDFQRTLQSVCP